LALERADVFHAIVMLDERFHREGYPDCYEDDGRLGRIEGKQPGVLHGARMGSEIRCYQGFTFGQQEMKALASLMGMIQKFPYSEPAYDKLREGLERIRAKLKLLCSLLNVRPDFKMHAEGCGLSF
uniref:Uncharacterized protein n=1 Tax=Spermophilus dauricus TaxID=99837 RepID=A0A8C9QHR7_SPEDA